MSDPESPERDLRGLLEARKEQVLKEAAEQAAAIERDIAELERLSAKYRLVVTAPAGALAPSTTPDAGSQAPIEPQAKNNQTFDGSLAGLVHCYATDEHSTIHKVRYRTRENYLGQCRRIVNDHGSELIKDITARSILKWHEEWSANGRIAMAHAFVGMLRMLFGFGATILNDAECARLCGVLQKMRFKMSRPRSERLTVEQANAIRAQAHKLGLPSVALAQALQFECKLRQKDVIGEWVPKTEAGESNIRDGESKWLHGIQWSQIDERLILTHTMSRGHEKRRIDLRRHPMVMEELVRFKGELPKSGPVIKYEVTLKPYLAHVFRRVWRQVADAAGIPKDVKNMDSRGGGSDEATDAGATSDEKAPAVVKAATNDDPVVAPLTRH
jgi:hypothetical protein